MRLNNLKPKTALNQNTISMKVFLIGMMGCGKSYWKKKIAAKHKIGGYDLDFLIESHEEKTISEIFAQDGETYFRKTEANILRWFAEKKAFVLATGGGTPCFHHNMEWMNEQGITIWIDESIEMITQRLLSEKQQRPLISQVANEELENYLALKLKERSSFYHQATYHLKSDQLNEAGFNAIIKKYV